MSAPGASTRRPEGRRIPPPVWIVLLGHMLMMRHRRSAACALKERTLTWWDLTHIWSVGKRRVRQDPTLWVRRLPIARRVRRGSTIPTTGPSRFTIVWIASAASTLTWWGPGSMPVVIALPASTQKARATARRRIAWRVWQASTWKLRAYVSSRSAWTIKALWTPWGMDARIGKSMRAHITTAAGA